jgi:hypothetical protein
MKKLLAIVIILIFFGTISASAISLSEQVFKPRPKENKTGTFEGEIGYPREGEWNAVGELSGTFQQRNRVSVIDGQWILTEREASGTVKAIFRSRILIGRITIDGAERRAPIIGFIFFREETQEFGGRFMSIIGPALYFKGTYQEN